MEVDPSKICGWLLVLNSGDLLRPVQFYEPAYLKKKKKMNLMNTELWSYLVTLLLMKLSIPQCMSNLS